MLKRLDQPPKSRQKRCIWYYTDSVIFAVSFFPLSYCMLFIYPKIFPALFAVWAIAGLIMLFGRQKLYEKGALQKKPIVVLRSVCYTLFLAALMLTVIYVSQAKLFYPIKRSLLSDRFGTEFSQVIPEKLPEGAKGYYFQYVPAWQDGDYLALKYHTDSEEAGRLADKAAQMDTEVFEFDGKIMWYMRPDLFTEDDFDGLTIYEFDKYTRIYVNRRTGFVMFERN